MKDNKKNTEKSEEKENKNPLSNADDKEFSDKALKDFDLIDLAVKGDQQAYAELMNRYKNSVYLCFSKW